MINYFHQQTSQHARTLQKKRNGFHRASPSYNVAIFVEESHRLLPLFYSSCLLFFTITFVSYLFLYISLFICFCFSLPHILSRTTVPLLRILLHVYSQVHVILYVGLHQRLRNPQLHLSLSLSHLVGRDAETRAHAPDARIGRGHVRVGAEVDVQHGGVSSLDEDALSRIEGGVRQHYRVVRHTHDLRFRFCDKQQGRTDGRTHTHKHTAVVIDSTDTDQNTQQAAA